MMKNTVKDLDPKSQQFIKYALNELSDENFLYTWADAYARVFDFYSEISAAKVRKLATAKMIAGAAEHGAPDPQRNYTKELQDEYLDLVLWGLMKKWVEGK